MSELYDVIVIGAGSGGLTAAVFGGEFGKKIALVERERIGGDCTWTGCMPSKALLKVAKIAHHIRTAGQYGITVSAPIVDMAFVRSHVQNIIQEVYQHETPEAVAKRGVEVILGEARFVNATTIQVGERQLQAKKFVIAAGGRPAIPVIPGIETVPYKTNRDIFENGRLPRHLLVMGAGPIGMEMGQAHVRLGSQVTIIGEQIMPRDEPEAVNVIKSVFQSEGIQFIQTRATTARMEGDDVLLSLQNGQEVRGDMLLVAVGRSPNVEDLDLENAGIIYTRQGIEVNRHLQTNVPHIYAIGDVTTGPKFTHYAYFQGAAAGRNSLLPLGKAYGHDLQPPWVTFTDPEIAHAGLTEADARKYFGESVKTSVFQMAVGDRSVAENDTKGFIKLVYRGRDQLIGATIVAERAGEMIIEYELVIKKKIGARAIIDTIHPYPTYSDITKKALSKLVVSELLSSKVGQLFKSLVRALP